MKNSVLLCHLFCQILATFFALVFLLISMKIALQFYVTILRVFKFSNIQLNGMKLKHVCDGTNHSTCAALFSITYMMSVQIAKRYIALVYVQLDMFIHVFFDNNSFIMQLFNKLKGRV